MYLSLIELAEIYNLTRATSLKIMRFYNVQRVSENPDKPIGKSNTTSYSASDAHAALGEYVSARNLISAINHKEPLSFIKPCEYAELYEMSSRNFAERGLKVDIESIRKFLNH
ncbi:MAG: hypothetical protein WCL34_15275 [Methylococcaceae bacterium]